MTKEGLYACFDQKYAQLVEALAGEDLEKMKALSLEVHALVHPAEVSGGKEKTVADYVLDYMLSGNQNALVPRQKGIRTCTTPGRMWSPCAGSSGTPTA